MISREALLKQMAEAGFQPLPRRLEESYVAQCKGLGIAVHLKMWEAPERGVRARSGRHFAPTWLVAIFMAEPMLPDTKTAAIKACLASEEECAAVASAFQLGDRYQTSLYLVERFG